MKKTLEEYMAEIGGEIEEARPRGLGEGDNKKNSIFTDGVRTLEFRARCGEAFAKFQLALINSHPGR
jgi:hypothetical protein